MNETEFDALENEQRELDYSDLEEKEERVCPISMSERKKVIEGVLFMSDRPVGLTVFVSAFGEKEEKVEEDGKEQVIMKPIVLSKEVEEALEEYEKELKEESRGFRLVSANGGYQLRTAEELKPYLQNTVKARSFRLTGPSLETLAIVAYKQPLTKSQVDEIRGVESSHLMRALMDKDLLAFAGKSELPGKPMLYKTTSKFLEIFGLRNLGELPSLEEIEALIPEGIGQENEEEKESLSELAGKLSEDFDGSYSTGEEELGKISDELSDISTSSEFFEEEKKREKERRDKEKAESIREALMLEEEVSQRDQNWLQRYDEKMAAESESASDEDKSKETESTEHSDDELLAAEEEINSSDDSNATFEDEGGEDNEEESPETTVELNT